MIDPRPLVGFVFTYTNHRPRPIEDLQAHPWVRLQSAMIQSFTKGRGLELSAIHGGLLVGRRKAFVDADEFRTVVEVARTIDADLVVGDMQELLSRTPASLIDHAIERLGQLDVSVWDARRGESWTSLDPARQGAIVGFARIASTTKSHSIALGLKMSKVKRTASAANAGKASNAYARQAARRAEELREFVTSQQLMLPAGTLLSPTVLARRLNEEGIPSARGGDWSLNAAKNLLKRLGPSAAVAVWDPDGEG